jgi:hypothetical protein
MRDLIEVCLPNDHSNQFSASEFNSLTGITDPGYNKRLACAPLIREWIE